MTRKQAALKVFMRINEELEKLEDKNSLAVKRLLLINEELCESVVELINKYECKSLKNYVTQECDSPTMTSEKPSVGI